MINILFPEAVLIKSSDESNTENILEDIIVEEDSYQILDQIRADVPNRVAEMSRLLEYLSKVGILFQYRNLII